MLTYWSLWQFAQGQLEEQGRPLSYEEALLFFEESQGVMVEPVAVLPIEDCFDDGSGQWGECA